MENLQSKANFLVSLKYKNSLPEIPFDPKLVPYQFEKDRFVQYSTTSLEKNNNHGIFAERNLGIAVDLVDPDAYSQSGAKAALEPADAYLLEEEPSLATGKKDRSKTHAKAMSWLRRTEYISLETGQNQQMSRSESSKNEPHRKDQNALLFSNSREAQIQSIEKSFLLAKNPILHHPNHKKLKPVKSFPLFPDFHLWGSRFVHVVFDGEPLGGEKIETSKEGNLQLSAGQENQLKNAFMKTMVSPNNPNDFYVSYFLPTQETLLEKQKSIQNGQLPTDMKFKFIRDYNMKQETKSDGNFFFVFRSSKVSYNPFQLKLKFIKRRLRNSAESSIRRPNRAKVNYRPFSEAEISEREDRLQSLLEGEYEDDLDQIVQPDSR